MWLRPVVLLSCAAGLAACAPVGVKLSTDQHISSAQAPASPSATEIPAPVANGFSLPPPKAQPKPETYSVVVNNVKVQDLLFALARDAKVNVDIHPGLTGTVTLNALDQTLPQLLTRISKQVDMRFELDGPNLAVMPDSPFLRTYKIDYVNMSRDSSSSISVATQISTSGSSSASGSAQSVNGSADNGSSTKIDNVSKNRFWETLVQNVKDLLRETDKVFPEGAGETTVEQNRTQTVTPTDGAVGRVLNAAAKALDSGSKSSKANTLTNDFGVSSTDSTTLRTANYREAASVIANPETGVITVRATSRQQEKVQEFLDQVMNSARRQVLIEATIAEVELSQNYQQGIDWSSLNVFGTGLRVIQSALGGISNPPSSLVEVGYDSSGGNFKSSLKFLESFGNVKVLSSPKISVLNNQTAVLKVVDNTVYFTIETNISRGTQGTQDLTTYTTTVHTVPIGLVMNVTPQIGEDDTVLLNLRPSISRIVGQAIDPNPSLKPPFVSVAIQNQIPIIRSREIESMLRVTNGNIAIMGGLMEDSLDNNNDTVPGLANAPIVGGIFQNHNDTKSKTELVIFLRPTVIHDASLEGDYRSYREQLPTTHFFDDNNIGPQLPKLPEAK